MDNNLIGWNFPGNQFGESNGISESGIETFKANPIASLTREVCQNSLDAIEDKSKPVYIEFERITINKEEIPGFIELFEAINVCYDYGKSEDNEKTIKFFKTALKSIDKEVAILRISDYNTTGLIGSKEYNKKSPWRNLVKANGISDKGGEAGGSFGIGKSASFACSTIRTIFYRTLDKFNIQAVQGISKLISFPREIDDNGDMTTGIGYYGIKNKNRPIEKCDILNKINERKEYGTDLFIFGFCGKDDWEKHIISELLEGFMMSFYKGLLVAKVGNEIIDNNMGNIIKKYSKYCSMVKEYYRVITEESIECSDDFQGMGTLRLKILLGEEFSRTVLLTRSNGMKLFDKNRMPRSIQFSAVLEMEGEKLNGYFRKMESPQHNAWEPGRYEEDAKEAERKLNALYKWIRDQIKGLVKCGDGNELDAEGVGDLIPDLFKDNNSGKKKEESMGGSTQNINFKIAEKTSINNFKDSGMEVDEIRDEVGEGKNDEFGDFESNGIPKNKSNKGNGGDGVPGKGSDEEGNRTLFGGKEVNNCKMRMFISNIQKKQYTLSFSSKKDIKEARLNIKIAGEQSAIDVNVKNAYVDNDLNKKLGFVRNNIILENIVKDQKNHINFQLEDEEIYPLEVKLYEN
ncbi:hypothetical protein FDA33_05320 [Clostridium botulinum]|nr:hypothetical protein [Clostridium botulinum]NFI16836.1 hypothetical protein [Clostridium botulinum]NFI54598.1 hypothetical protein [Clostridium botulinum]NFL91550.1 hypothetical protein [Clostridium botulinum]NFN51467.1 hypothetical protein [Clostridium botulinum]